MAPVGRGASVGNAPTRAVAISMVIVGILMVLFVEVASRRINYFRGAAGAARLTCCGGVVFPPSVCVVVVVFVDVGATCPVYLALLSTIYVKTDVLNNYGEASMGYPRSII